MKRIGIIKCIHANNVCTGAGCLRAFTQRTDYFRFYGPDTELAVFMGCNGCQEEQPMEPEEDPGMLEKLDRLVKEQVTVIHAGACRIQNNGQECKRLEKIFAMMEQRGIRVERGTHKE